LVIKPSTWRASKNGENDSPMLTTLAASAQSLAEGLFFQIVHHALPKRNASGAKTAKKIALNRRSRSDLGYRMARARLRTISCAQKKELRANSQHKVLLTVCIVEHLPKGVKFSARVGRLQMNCGRFRCSNKKGEPFL